MWEGVEGDLGAILAISAIMLTLVVGCLEMADHDPFDCALF